jgi:uncharacterized protein involved in exopolysaccharide biosynthesis
VPYPAPAISAGEELMIEKARILSMATIKQARLAPQQEPSRPRLAMILLVSLVWSVTASQLCVGLWDMLL